MPDSFPCVPSRPCGRRLREAMPPPWTALPEEIISRLESAKVLYGVCQLLAVRETASRHGRTGGDVHGKN